MKNLFVFAHPDDEIIPSGLIQRLEDTGFIWVTNGDYRTEANREEESRNAMESLGVQGDRLNFLNYSETKLLEQVAEESKGIALQINSITKDILKRIINENPGAVYTDAFQGGHIAHDLVSFCVYNATGIARRTIQKNTELIEFPQYQYDKDSGLIVGAFGTKGEGPTKEDVGMENGIITLTDEELERKVKMAECYPSRQASINELSSAYPEENRRNEAYRTVKERDYLRKPAEHIFYEGHLREKYGLEISFKNFVASIEAYKKFRQKL